MTMERRNRPLYRDPTDKMLGGVCSGLAQYFDIDTVLVRVGFVVVATLGGGGVLAYILLWAILDPAPPGHRQEPSESPTLASDESTEQGIDTVDISDRVEQPEDLAQAPELPTDET